MKKMLSVGMLALLMAPGAMALADGPAQAAAVTATAKVKPAKKQKAKKVAAQPAKHHHWVCPMHDGGESDHAGKCPKCGMDMVEVD
jgi:hypothetical protein